MKNSGIALIMYSLLIILLIAGEIQCIVKAVRCNWEPVGKAEIVYTASALCGVGSIVGWIDIEDE